MRVLMKKVENLFKIKKRWRYPFRSFKGQWEETIKLEWTILKVIRESELIQKKV